MPYITIASILLETVGAVHVFSETVVFPDTLVLKYGVFFQTVDLNI